MEVEQNAVVARNMRRHRELDTRFHHLGRRFTTIVNHTDGNLITHEHLSFGIIERRNLRRSEHFCRSVTHQVRNSNLEIVVQEACRNRGISLTHSRRGSVRERLDCTTDSARTGSSARRSGCSTRRKRSRTHRSGPVHTKFTSKFAVHNHKLCGNHDLESFHIKFGKGVTHLFDLAFRIINDDGVRTFHDRNLTAIRLHAFEHLDQFISLSMMHLEVLTNKRSILFSLIFFVGKLFLLCLVSAQALDGNVLVLNHPCKVIHITNNIQSFLPCLLGHTQADLALDIRSNQNVHACNHRHRTENCIVVHVDEVKVI